VTQSKPSSFWYSVLCPEVFLYTVFWTCGIWRNMMLKWMCSRKCSTLQWQGVCPVWIFYWDSLIKAPCFIWWERHCLGTYAQSSPNVASNKPCFSSLFYLLGVLIDFVLTKKWTRCVQWMLQKMTVTSFSSVKAQGNVPWIREDKTLTMKVQRYRIQLFHIVGKLWSY
jgi:hypothetical protein